MGGGAALGAASPGRTGRFVGGGSVRRAGTRNADAVGPATGTERAAGRRRSDGASMRLMDPMYPMYSENERTRKSLKHGRRRPVCESIHATAVIGAGRIPTGPGRGGRLGRAAARSRADRRARRGAGSGLPNGHSPAGSGRCAGRAAGGPAGHGRSSEGISRPRFRCQDHSDYPTGAVIEDRRRAGGPAVSGASLLAIDPPSPRC
jgi:hypothetical protein